MVAAITALPCLRARFCRLKATILAVSRSRVLVNSSRSQNCAGVSASCAMW